MFGVKRQKILAYVLAFDQYEIIKKSLDFITQFHNRLEIVIIENPSKNTPKISKLIDSYGENHLIDRYYLFDENITGFAYSVILDLERRTLEKRQFVILSDGDLTVKDPGWLDEQLAIIKQNPEIFACGVSMDMINLPVKAFPEAVNWIPPDIKNHHDYFEARTGAHLLLLRNKDLLGFMDWRERRNLPFVDSNMHYYCYDQLHRQWARTKKAKAYHLTWDLYKDRDNAYTKLKTSKSHEKTWYHNKASSYRLRSY